MNGMYFRHSVLGAAIALTLIACGGGGGGGSMVRSDPPPPPPPPPPSSSAPEPCPPPIAGDCAISSEYTFQFDEFGMTGGRQSDFGLFVMGGDDTYVNLRDGDYRFSGGTQIAGTTLVVWSTLESDVDILRDYTGLGFEGESTLWLLGTVKGDVHNDAHMSVRCWSGINDCSSIPQQWIEGNYEQTANGDLVIGLGRPLMISGMATLAGDLILTKGDNNYVLPNTPTSELLIHANGGVTGVFDSWNADNLFLEGSLRYEPEDVWFDLSRISTQAAMASQALGSQLTLASAGNLDRVLSVADAFGALPTPSQQRFLDSAARLLWMRDPAQAVRALDSLSGIEHAAGLRKASEGTAQQMAVGVHLDRVQAGQAVGAWALADGAGTVAGIDQWLGPHLLLGVRTSERAASGDTDGVGRDLGTGAYLRWFGNAGWYAGADAGFTRRTLGLARTIDFGEAGRWQARSRRIIDAMDVSGEVGRRMALGGGTLTPFVGAELALVHGAASIEQGASGFELALADASQHAVHAKAGLRFARDWRLGDGAWLGLQASTGLERRVTSGGDAQQASFTGVPDAWFALPGTVPTTTRWTSLGLQGGWGRGWRWSAYRATGALAFDQQWSLMLRREW